nr:hypothetical protein [Tanacetum cinerariifolium]
MAEFLCLPNFQGCKVAAGALSPPGSARVTHLASMVERLEDLLPKNGDMEIAEIPCRKVLDDKEKKKKKAKAKAAANVLDVDIQIEKVTGKRCAGKKGTSRTKRKHLEALANEEHISANVSVGRMDVLRNQTEEHVTPRPIVNVKEPVVGEEKDQENVGPDFAKEGNGDNEDGLSGLCTQPNPVHYFDQCLESVERPVRDTVVPDAEEIRGYVTSLPLNSLGSYYANPHSNMKVHYKECKKELAKLQSPFDKKVSAYGHLSEDYDAVLTRKKGLQERVRELEKVKVETKEVCMKQANRIKQLEVELKQSKVDTHRLRVDREKFAVECGNGEMVRRKIINEYLPTFVHRLHQSVEYKRSLGDGGAGSIKQINFAGDKIEKVSYDIKFEGSTDGGTVSKMTTTIYTHGDFEIKEEELKAGKEKVLGLYKVIEAYLLKNPDAYV